ncbi:MAG: hypothetical protein J6K48_06985 [Lachnospiraceae bacterium]|nr:hypothetical protein [Lachnospiraceae bacterium]
MIALFVFVMVAFIMIGIGISQLRSKKPVGFYSGEQPPEEEELSDVYAWNVRHGVMWMVYGVIIIISYVILHLIGDSAWAAVPTCIGLVAPLIIMIWYHHKLIGQYKRKKEEEQ